MRDLASSFDRLVDHHARIEAILARGESSLAAQQLDAIDLGRGRWELARALSAYQHFKHVDLLDPLIARGTPHQAQIARRMRTACIRFGEDFRAHLMLWGSASILDDWARYQPDAQAMLKRIRAHLQTERRQAETLVRGGRAVA